MKVEAIKKMHGKVINQDPDFEALLNYLKRTRGFDFTGYKRPSLTRLMNKRMARVGVDSYSEYLNYLQAKSLEVSQLFDALLLNVTTFFRDRPAWESLAVEVIPSILAAKRDKETIRVWSAGCASGEEAYTIAIILAEALGTEEFRKRVKIYATDVDEDALTHGRLASYTVKELRDVPEELQQKYFESSKNSYTFRNELRRCVIFGRHDLVQDAPISRLDLLVCRNTLMYFNAETQARILARFHFALNDTGFLFVGKAEMLLTHANLFTPGQLKYRIFAKVLKVGWRDSEVSKERLRGMVEEHSPDPLLVIAQGGNTEAGNYLEKNMRLRDEAFDCLPVAQIVVDLQGNLRLANRLARTLFGISTQDFGHSLQDLEISSRLVELGAQIKQAYAERCSVQINSVEQVMPVEGNTIYLDIEVIPLMDSNAELLGVTVVFTDVTRYKHLQLKLNRSTHKLETTKENLQSNNKKLETTNEELYFSPDQLQSTNQEINERTIETENLHLS